MKLKVIVHEAEEGGYWAEIPSLPGCVTEGDSMEELIANVREAAEGWLSVDKTDSTVDERSRIVEIVI
jgi:predicted RNase H-like HicB family nuclease